MKKSNSAAAISVGLALVAIGPLVQAQERAQEQLQMSGDWYLGASVGSAQFQRRDMADPYIFVPGQYFDDGDMAYSLRLGRAFTPWFALELAYSDLGKGEDQYWLRSDVEFIVPPNDREALEVSSLELVGVVSYTFANGFAMFSKFGIAQQHYQSRYFGGVGTGDSERDTDLAGVFGLGASYALADAVKLRLDLSHSRNDAVFADSAMMGLDFSF